MNKEIILKEGDILKISKENSNVRMIIKCMGEFLHFDEEKVDRMEELENLPKKKIIDKDTIEYEVDEGLYVFYHTMDALYQKFYGCLPKSLEKKIVELMVELLEVAEYSDNRDVKTEEFLKRVTYESK